ncbi:MAG: hypothetical protein NTY04_01100, partial [Candidatus Staskawiczbacteria bacterium]|nr:hypothetical protein [Candidatus Staskawiczbacteria bacterium]
TGTADACSTYTTKYCAGSFYCPSAPDVGTCNSWNTYGCTTNTADCHTWDNDSATCGSYGDCTWTPSTSNCHGYDNMEYSCGLYGCTYDAGTGSCTGNCTGTHYVNCSGSPSCSGITSNQTVCGNLANGCTWDWFTSNCNNHSNCGWV